MYNHTIQYSEYFDLIHAHPLFSGLTAEEITAFLDFASPKFYEMEPGQHIRLDPGIERKLGIVLTGAVKVFAIDYDGNKSVLNALRGRGAVGTLMFMMELYNMIFEISADDAALLLLFDPDVLLKTDAEHAVIQHKLLVNLMNAQHDVYVTITRHLVCLSQRTIRNKIMRYLQIRSEMECSYEFDIPLSRDDMAAYLAVDRASLSRSLGELKNEGVIDFRKNHFKILDTGHFHY